MRHSIRKETLNVKVATQETAWELQPRLRDFNRNHLLPVIERVLDDLAVEGRQIRVPALRLDLGQLPREGFEALAAERLDHELRKALAEAIAGANRDSAPGSQSRSEDESQLDALEHYLQFGKLPFWGTPATAFSLETALLELLERDPSGVHRLMRRLGGRSWAIQRLVFQLTELTLERLLNLLQPQSAALIIAGIHELCDIQREAMASAVNQSNDERKFVSMLLVSAFTYLLLNTAPAFNRRSFVRHLLGDMADHESLGFYQFVTLLERALTRLETGRSPDPSLPIIIRALMREEEIARTRSSDELLHASEELVAPPDSSLPATTRKLAREEEIARAGSSGETLPAAEGLASPPDSSFPIITRKLVREEEIARAESSHEPLPTAEELVSPPDSLLPAVTGAVVGEEQIAGIRSSDEPLPAAEELIPPPDTFSSTIIGEVVGEEQITRADSPAHEPLGDSRELIRPLTAEIPSLTEDLRATIHELPVEQITPESPADEASQTSKELVRPLTAEVPSLTEDLRVTIRELPGEEQPDEQTTPGSPPDEALQISKDLVRPLTAEVPGLEEKVLRATIRELPGEEQPDEQITPESPPDEALQTSKDLVRPSAGEVPGLTEENILALIKKGLPQTGDTANVFLTALLAHAAGIEDKPAFYFRVLRAMQEGRILDLEELSKTSPEEQAILPQLEEAGEELESTAERQVRPPVGKSTADGETHLPMSDTPASGLPRRFAQEREIHQPGSERPRVPGTRVRSAFSLHESQESPALGEPLYIDNAGLVLTAPFLLRLFNSLNMLRTDENGKSHWPDQETASRAVHLLQYLVDERVSAPEPLLVLNKLLCGLPLAMPVEKSITMTDGELAACEKLLRSMLANWKALSGTSIAGLRETFFQRQGRLEQSDIGWKLQVQRKTVDVLVDQIPWSISVVFHAWMPSPLHVTW